MDHPELRRAALEAAQQGGLEGQVHGKVEPGLSKAGALLGRGLVEFMVALGGNEHHHIHLVTGNGLDEILLGWHGHHHQGLFCRQGALAPGKGQPQQRVAEYALGSVPVPHAPHPDTASMPFVFSRGMPSPACQIRHGMVQ
jgi:hypothetical protein